MSEAGQHKETHREHASINSPLSQRQHGVRKELETGPGQGWADHPTDCVRSVLSLGRWRMQ